MEMCVNSMASHGRYHKAIGGHINLERKQDDTEPSWKNVLSFCFHEFYQH